MPQSRPRYQWLLIILAALVVLSSIVAIVPPVISYVKKYQQEARAERRAYDAMMRIKVNPPQDLSPFKGNFAGVKMAISRAYLMPIPGAVEYTVMIQFGHHSIGTLTWMSALMLIPLEWLHW